MTIIDRPAEAEVEPLDVAPLLDPPPGDESVPADAAPAPDEPDADEAGPLPASLRSLAVALLSCTGAALSTGGIFGSWSARALCVAAAVAGGGWTWVCATRRRHRLALQLTTIPLIVVLASFSVAVGAGGRSPATLVSKAIQSGRLLSIPIPFDAGWRPILLTLFFFLGFGTAWVGVRLERAQTALLMPLPLLALTLISQPSSGQVVAGFLGLVPLLAAATLLFGSQGGDGLGREFEVKRLLRSVAFAVPLLLVVVLLAQTSFLFPKPAYDPTNKPQKPKAIPLSAAVDRVLFEVEGPLTGPWVIGALDVYDGKDWRLAPVDPKRFRSLPGDGVIDPHRSPDVSIHFTTRDLGDSSTFPTVATPAKASFPGGVGVAYDPRTETLRVKSGRLPSNYSYDLALPAYPTPKQLEAADPDVPPAMREFLQIPPAPPAVQDLLATAPTNPWQRLDTLRAKLNEVVIAAGAGTPGPMKVETVQKLLAGDHEGTPFEIVAAEAMLARWAGVPSRIGFGFDAGQKEGDVTTIRPKNAAQFLEVWFKGFGWVPLVSAPPKAKTSLDADKDRIFNPTVKPSDDVSAQLVIPLESKNLTFVYDAVRRVLLEALPVALLLLALYLAYPWVMKRRRSSRRQRWSAAKGPRWEVAAAYAELRDLATDLSIGDPLDTPLEYLGRVVPDPQHDELAWLVSRVMYGDLGPVVGPAEATAAWALSRSLQRRLAAGQPRQTRVLAATSRSSLLEPYTTEVPNVRLVQLTLRGRLRWLRPRASVLALRRRLRPGRRAAAPVGRMQAAAAAMSARGRAGVR